MLCFGLVGSVCVLYSLRDIVSTLKEIDFPVRS
jgi:hypothetical protein